MKCPKCLAPCGDELSECPRCGVVFAKVAQRAPGPAEPPAAPVAGRAQHDSAADPVSRIVHVGRAALLAGLVIWTWQFARAPIGAGAMDSVLHLPNLVFHEAGHVIFGLFGRFIGVLGGSLFQVAVPIALAAVFLRQRDPFGASVCTWWAGQNLLDLAPYVADARSLRIVLLGGKTGAEVEGHDWEYILGALGWLHMDRTLGLAAHRVGLLIMIGALLWSATLLARRAGRSRMS